MALSDMRLGLRAVRDEVLDVRRAPCDDHQHGGLPRLREIAMRRLVIASEWSAYYVCASRGPDVSRPERLVAGDVKRVAAAWKEQYKHGQKWGECLGGSAHTVYKRLLALDPATATREDIETIIGNDSWTKFTCDGCSGEVELAVRVGMAPDYDSSTATLCAECVVLAAAVLRGSAPQEAMSPRDKRAPLVAAEAVPVGGAVAADNVRVLATVPQRLPVAERSRTSLGRRGPSPSEEKP